jgi:hypothetical protein
MTFDAMWKAYTDRNPHWLADGATFTPDGLPETGRAIVPAWPGAG